MIIALWQGLVQVFIIPEGPVFEGCGMIQQWVFFLSSIYRILVTPATLFQVLPFLFYAVGVIFFIHS